MPGIAHDDAATLIRMANQIATAFRLEPEDRAVPAMREHIGKFWTRAMRTRLKTLAAADTPDLDARIRRAFG
ncbi:formate dehydrogenase subunit delta [Prosthecodimorpha staleyi]|uniref:Formate dehydrogenase subunit delta n=1 Tax=Prosthecodimorpha staleyi TaxID=2840188 RepID=A0A947GG38_9HYPH|nr:formate dehydrogenase subunit delta [Prosthecodimorpha staleyi]MBT9291455.1 formate dehydrogenase subunit delta [Prosthecodimorpha staleyi]